MIYLHAFHLSNQYVQLFSKIIFVRGRIWYVLYYLRNFIMVLVHLLSETLLSTIISPPLIYIFIIVNVVSQIFLCRHMLVIQEFCEVISTSRNGIQWAVWSVSWRVLLGSLVQLRGSGNSQDSCKYLYTCSYVFAYPWFII